MGKDYGAGIKEGRRQIIANLKKHYEESYSDSPGNFPNCEIGVLIPESTLCRYFKEIKKKGGEDD